jgi:hypothetical protein
MEVILSPSILTQSPQLGKEKSAHPRQRCNLKPRRRRPTDADRPFPEEANSDLLAYAAKLGAKPEQLAFAEALEQLGLHAKARRAALCGRLGTRLICDKECHQLYRRFWCGLRSCSRCGRLASKRVAENHEAQVRGTIPQMERECRKRGHPYISNGVEFATATLDPPSPDDVKEFNERIKRFFSAVRRRLGISNDAAGMVFLTEIDGNVIRGRGFYSGPPLPTDSEGTWSNIAGPNAKITITPERSVSSGVRDALRHSVDATPAGLAELEAAFDGVRRVHSLGSFYAAPTGTNEERNRCPLCGGALLAFIGPMVPIQRLEAEGVPELSEVRRQMRDAGPQRADA